MREPWYCEFLLSSGEQITVIAERDDCEAVVREWEEAAESFNTETAPMIRLSGFDNSFERRKMSVSVTATDIKAIVAGAV